MKPIKRIPLAALASLLLFFPALTRANPAVEAWVQRYNGPGNSSDYASVVAVDSSNNVIVTGGSYGSGSNYDYATIKYSSAGVPLWTNRYNGPENSFDSAYAVAVDSSNNIIVTGSSVGNGSSSDYATIKYSSAGVPLWTNRYNGPGNDDDDANALAADSSNNVIVTGNSYGSVSSRDCVTIKYSSTGVPLWTNRYIGPIDARAVAVDGSNNVIVTGGGNDGYTTIKYSNVGVPLWTNRYNGPRNSDDFAKALAVDGSNNIIVTGDSSGATGFYDYATIEYSSAGVPLWTNRYNGPGNNNDYANALAVDGSNNVIVTGSSYEGSIRHYATIEYSSAGVPLWTNRYNGPGNSDGFTRALAVDSSNNVIVTGGAIGNGSYYDMTTIQYSSAGVPLWTNRYNGPANSSDYAYDVAVDGSNNVIVTGSSTGSGSSYDYVTVKYSSAGAPLLSITRTTTNTVIVSWSAPADGWVLECTNILDTFDAWPQVPPPYLTNETTLWATFTNTPATNSQFYRLQKPSGWGPSIGAF